MDKKTRLTKAFNLERPDRPPILGGVLAAPPHVWTLTGCSEDDYWADPFHWGLEAERALGSDGVITILVPVSRGEYRCIDERDLHRRASYSIEGVLDEIAALPDPAEIVANFDEEAEYRRFVAEYQARQAQCGDILWCPADWDIIPKALWYQEFGYENALLTLAMYPDEYRKLIQVSAEKGRLRSGLLARAIGEGIYPRAIMTGEDLCTQRGPLVSPDYLRREYFPLVQYALEPLVRIGAKPVWHCDGDYRLLVDDVLACGVGGLQGFQDECGMQLDWIVEKRTKTGDPLIIFGPMSVTRTLPFGTPDDIRAEVRRVMDCCRDKVSLVFNTSNDITPDIPLDNIRAFWDSVLESTW